MMPLDYMLSVMRNPDADQARRDRMAQAAAPYCHGRVAETKGKKEAQAEQAKIAAQDWAGDLEFDTQPN
jgi:phage terminase small subunit